MNYWTIDIHEDLPSRGILYPADSYIKIRPMSVGNCKYLCTLNKDDYKATTKMLNEVLSSCLETNIQFNELAWADRNYLLFWLRVNSFITSNGYELDINCPVCNGKISKTLKLGSLDVRYHDQCRKKTAKLKIGEEEFVACGVILQVKDDKLYADDKIVEDILNYTNIRDAIPADVEPSWWVSRLDAMNFALLKSIAADSKFGLEGIIYVGCDSCGARLPVDVDLSDTNMFGRLSLYDILKVQVQVSKYCGFQVSDDLSYTDVEIMQEVIKQLIEEEKAEMEKANSNGISLSRGNVKLPNFK